MKEDIEDVSSELGNGVKDCTSWLKRPELYCSRFILEKDIVSVVKEYQHPNFSRPSHPRVTPPFTFTVDTQNTRTS
ncbi:hypothetical protein TNCV_3351551 [Trichonephila clavipes]|nr:hypothetical protein TNCV_3351551 [Trichonephila clavipes]